MQEKLDPFVGYKLNRMLKMSTAMPPSLGLMGTEVTPPSGTKATPPPEHAGHASFAGSEGYG